MRLPRVKDKAKPVAHSLTPQLLGPRLAPPQTVSENAGGRFGRVIFRPYDPAHSELPLDTAVLERVGDPAPSTSLDAATPDLLTPIEGGEYRAECGLCAHLGPWRISELEPEIDESDEWEGFRDLDAHLYEFHGLRTKAGYLTSL